MYILQYFIVACLSIWNKIEITTQMNLSTYVHKTKQYYMQSYGLKKRVLLVDLCETTKYQMIARLLLFWFRMLAVWKC